MSSATIKFLNSPFCVTLLGGAFAALISHWWQSDAARNAYQRSVLEQELKDRRAVSKDFADNFGAALYYTEDFLERRLWIGHHHREPAHVYPDGRRYSAELAYYESIESRVFSHPTAESLAARVTTTFSSALVQSSASKLTTALRNMVDDQSEDKLEEDFDVANREYERVIADAQAEISSFYNRWENAK